MKSFAALLTVAVAGIASAVPLSGQVGGGPSKDPEIWMSCPQVIQRWGYPVEQYQVTTDDGYILTMFRIPHGQDPASKTNDPKPVVYLQHGLESSSYDWIANLPNESAAFIFADSGFDVWLGNFRGNMYGMQHTTMNVSDHAFWQFSWDEMAQYDLPTMVNKILDVTQASSVYYVGHSMGTTSAFAAFSRNKDLEQKIKRFYALAPVATVKHVEGPIKYLAPFTRVIDAFCQYVGYDDFLPSDELTHLMAETFCSFPKTDPLCEDVLVLLCGPESNQLNMSRTPVYISHTPAGSSTNTVAHYGQEVNDGKFQMFDYGREQNRKRYGQTRPPLYEVTEVQVPTFLYWGDSDWLADPTDVAALIPQVRNLVGNVNLTDFNHLDFVWGLRAAAEIYYPIAKDISTQAQL